jgi:small-conductance mechanosensitive channel/CRP-like cAMP-binding protein
VYGSLLPSAGLTVAACVFLSLAVATFALLPSERLRLARLTVLFVVSATAVFVLERASNTDLGAVLTVVRAVAAFFAGVCIIRTAGILLVRVALVRLHYSPPRILQEVVAVIAMAAWGIVLLRNEGVDPTSLITTSAVLTAIVGLSLQDTLGNLLGGLALQSDHSIKVGDWIQVDSTAGQVVEINWRHTSIETNNWETMIVPNSQLVKNRFVALGRYGDGPVQHRRTLPFYVDAEREPHEVIEAVEDSLRRMDLPGVAKTPLPECLLLDLAESPVRYAASYWLSNLASPNPTDSSVRVQTYLALERAGISVAVPSRTVRMHEETAEDLELRRNTETDRRVVALRAVDLFERLEDDDLVWLAGRLTEAPYLVGDTLVRQGAPSRRLYIIVHGTADVFIEGSEPGRVRIAELGPGMIFGEMGMMTDEPRTATVVARTKMLTYRLDREGFRDLLHRRPDVADHIAEVFAVRRVELDSVRESLQSASGDRGMSTKRYALGATIRHLFGLADGERASKSRAR